MDRKTERRIAREGIITVFFIMPVVIVFFIMYMLFEVLEVYSYPSGMAKAGEIVIFALIFGYLIQLLVRLAKWGFKTLKEE